NSVQFFTRAVNIHLVLLGFVTQNESLQFSQVEHNERVCCFLHHLNEIWAHKFAFQWKVQVCFFEHRSLWKDITTFFVWDPVGCDECHCISPRKIESESPRP